MSESTSTGGIQRIQELLAPNCRDFMRLIDFLKKGREAYTDHIGGAVSVLWSEDPRLEELGYQPEEIDAFDEEAKIRTLFARVNEICGGSLHYIVGVCCPPHTDLKRDRPIHEWFEDYDEFAAYSRWGSYLLSDITIQQAEECGITVDGVRTAPVPGVFQVRDKDTTGYGASFRNDGSEPVYILSFINVDGLREEKT